MDTNASLRSRPTQKARETTSFPISSTMPELPEVEAARRAIEEHCIGKKIAKSIIANDAKVIDGVSPSDFETSLLNKTIVAAHRKGKNMWLQLDSPPFPSFQFGMSGAIYIKGVAVTKYKRSAVNDTDEWPSKYSKVFIELDDGLEMSFTDKRRFARVRLLDDPASVPPISELGPDALLEPMSVDELYSSLRKKKLGIKALLLDQSFVSGVGNWIADEVLYQARIHPMQIASTLSKESCATLDRCIKEVIGKAVEVGAVSSQYPSNWIFHSREKKPGKAFVNGKKIDFINAGGRTTAYVPELQKLSVTEASKAFTKTSKRTSRRDKDEDSGDTDNHDANEPESEKDAEKEKSKQQDSKNDKKGKRPPRSKKSMRIDENDVEHKKETGNRGKMVPSKRNSKGSTDDDVAAKQRKKPRVESRKVATDTKSKANGGSKGGSGDDDGSDGNVDEKKSSKGTKGKQPKEGNSSKRKADTDHNGKQTKKKAK